MGDPYLSKDESLILSTQNIRIDGKSLDLMLTSRRLILIDNSVNPFHLRTIPLDSIITVVAGMDVKGEPVFTLSHMDPSGSGAPQPMDFIFVRQKGKSRSKECNEWAATLNIHAAGARNGALSSGTLPYDPVKTIQPRMSATYMIETFSPRKPVIEAYPEKAGVVTTPVPVKFPVVEGILSGIDQSAPLKNVEMVEPFDSPYLLSQEPEKMEMPDKEEPISQPDVIAIEADEKASITDSEEPASTPQEIATGPHETPEITDSEEPASTPQEIATGPHETPEITDSEEPASTPQEIATGPHETPEITDSKAPVSPPQEIATGTNDNPTISDAAQIWADAVRTATTPLPVNPVINTTATLSDGKNTDEKSMAEPINKNVEDQLSEINKDDRAADHGRVGSPAPNADPVPAAISPPVPIIPKCPYCTIQNAAIVIIILVVIGVAAIGSFYLLNSSQTPPPVVVPIVTVQPTPTPVPTLVPADGVWVRIEYPGTFIGEVGNPEIMHPAYGSGVRIYKILWSDRLVHAFAQKQENTGDTLTIEIYNNGTLIKSSSTRAPKGSVDLLIDPTTGQPPGVKPKNSP
ncbi:MAG: hypothetical protein Q8S57_05785 [Methanoregula sp.]|nr:hypothetical protein [Methanoregula sp.]